VLERGRAKTHIRLMFLGAITGLGRSFIEGLCVTGDKVAGVSRRRINDPSLPASVTLDWIEADSGIRSTLSAIYDEVLEVLCAFFDPESIQVRLRALPRVICLARQDVKVGRAVSSAWRRLDGGYEPAVLRQQGLWRLSETTGFVFALPLRYVSNFGRRSLALWYEFNSSSRRIRDSFVRDHDSRVS